MTYGQVLTRIASESGMMAVYPRLLDETGIVSLKEKLLLDDMEGIRIAGSGSLHILAAGEVKITGSEVRVAGTGGVLLYEGTAEADWEGNIVVAPQGKIELSAEDGERAIHNCGKEVTYYLAWEHEDLSHPSNRYRDAPQQKNYDWMKLGTHVAAGLMVAGGIAALAAGGVLLLGGAAATAAKMAMTVFLAGSLYVGEQALSDIRSGRVSDLDQYTRKAVAGSVVGFLTGASGLFLTGASLGRVLALGFGEGLVGSIVTQKLLNEDGEIDWGVAIAEAGFSAVTAGLAWKERRGVRGGGGGGEVLESGKSTLDDWVDKIQDLSKQAPIEISSNATVKVQAKNGYDQISFKWVEEGQNYEVRWHTKTPRAPEGQGNTWVVSRVTPGTPTGQARTEHILVGDTWIPRYQWQDAVNAYRNETATQEQLKLLKDGHWQAL